MAKPFRQREVGQQRLAELDLHVAALGDPQRVVARDLDLAEQLAHLVRGLEVVLVARELETVRVAHQRPRLHAQQGVVSVVVVLVGVVRVVRGQQWRAQLLGDLHQLRVGPVLFGDPVVLDLHEEIVSPEDVLESAGRLIGALLVAVHQRLEHVPTEAPSRGDHTLGCGR